MANLTALFFVVLVIVLGIGACWVITANSATMTTPTDTFGENPPSTTTDHNTASSELAVSSMPVVMVGFFVMVCVILVAVFAWLWKSGKSKPSRY